MNACALIGQSAVGYCAGKPTEIHASSELLYHNNNNNNNNNLYLHYSGKGKRKEEKKQNIEIITYIDHKFLWLIS